MEILEKITATLVVMFVAILIGDLIINRFEIEKVIKSILKYLLVIIIILIFIIVIIRIWQ